MTSPGAFDALWDDGMDDDELLDSDAAAMDPGKLRLVDLMCGHPHPEPAIPSLNQIVRSSMARGGKPLLCCDGTSTGTSMRTFFDLYGIQAADDAFTWGGFDNSAVVCGRVDDVCVPSASATTSSQRKPAFLVRYDLPTLMRIDCMRHPGFWLEIDVRTLEPYRKLEAEVARLRAMLEVKG